MVRKATWATRPSAGAPSWIARLRPRIDSATPAPTARNQAPVAARAVSGGVRTATRVLSIPRGSAGTAARSGVLGPRSRWWYVHQPRRVPPRRGRRLEVRAVAVQVAAHRRQLDRCGLQCVVQALDTDPYDAVPRLQRLGGVPDGVAEVALEIRYDDVGGLQ